MPLPSSDRRKDTVHFGDSSFTVWCMILEKLKRQTMGEGRSVEDEARELGLTEIRCARERSEKWL